jgi:RNA polymerase primary sigma factor
MDRSLKQKEIEEQFIKLVKSGVRGGALAAATGFGKTRVGLNITKRLKEDELVIVVVPTISLKQQWEELIKEHELKNKISVFVVNTYLTLKDEERVCSFLILDEAHRYSNDSKYFNTVIDITKFKWCLTLSATYTKEQLEFLKSKGIILFATVKLETAALHGWVSRFKQYNLAVELTEEEKKEYTKANNIIKAHAPYLYGLDIFKDGKNKQKLLDYCKENSLNYKEIQMRIARHNIASQLRKSIVYNAKNKIEIIPKVINQVGKKAIVFSETKSFVELLHKSMPDTSVLYHSSLANKEKERALEAIKLDNIKAICAPKALDEGVDIPSLKCGIIASGTSVERQQIQRCGRVIRYVPDEIAIIVNLYAKDTIEETWVKKRQKNMTNIRWITEVTEII